MSHKTVSQQTITRRTALEGLTAAGLASAISESSLIGETASELGEPQQRLNVGVITEPTGAHLSGFLQGLARCRSVEKVAIADPTGETFERAKRALGERFAGSFRDYQKMLQTLQPGLSVITLEAYHSPPAMEAALKAGSHVLTEKPGCVDVKDFERVVRLAEEKKRHLMMALATRSSAAVKKARQLIESGWLGKGYSTTMDWIADQTRLKSRSYQESWLSFKDKAGGGKLIFHGIHYLDLIQYLTGDRIQQVAAFCENVGGQPIEVEDAAVLSFRFPGGMVGVLNTGYYLDRGYQNQVRVWGANGWIHLNLTTGQPMQWFSTHPEAPRGIQEFTYTDGSRLYELFLQQAIDASLGQTEPPITGQECLHVLKVIFAAYRGAETGATMKIS